MTPPDLAPASSLRWRVVAPAAGIGPREKSELPGAHQQLAVAVSDPLEAGGVNSREQLARVAALLANR